jgi:hypothetical protein
MSFLAMEAALYSGGSGASGSREATGRATRRRFTAHGRSPCSCCSSCGTTTTGQGA